MFGSDMPSATRAATISSGVCPSSSCGRMRVAMSTGSPCRTIGTGRRSVTVRGRASRTGSRGFDARRGYIGDAMSRMRRGSRLSGRAHHPLRGRQQEPLFDVRHVDGRPAGVLPINSPDAASWPPESKVWRSGSRRSSRCRNPRRCCSSAVACWGRWFARRFSANGGVPEREKGERLALSAASLAADTD